MDTENHLSGEKAAKGMREGDEYSQNEADGALIFDQIEIWESTKYIKIS